MIVGKIQIEICFKNVESQNVTAWESGMDVKLFKVLHSVRKNGNGWNHTEGYCISFVF